MNRLFPRTDEQKIESQRRDVGSRGDQAKFYRNLIACVRQGETLLDLEALKRSARGFATRQQHLMPRQGSLFQPMKIINHPTRRGEPNKCQPIPTETRREKCTSRLLFFDRDNRSPGSRNGNANRFVLKHNGRRYHNGNRLHLCNRQGVDPDFFIWIADHDELRLRRLGWCLEIHDNLTPVRGIGVYRKGWQDQRPLACATIPSSIFVELQRQR